MRRREKGFTLIELLIVVAIIGIIAAIAIPNLLNAIDRGKQKRTMADMRSIGTAVEAYAVDNNIYPTHNENTIENTVGQDVTAGGVQPIYIKQCPLVDGWSNAMDYVSDGTAYTVVSGGKDGSDPDPDLEGGAQSGAGSFAADIVFTNGSFVQWPEGTQQ
jgi:general secretion pathway protein G